MHDAAPDDGATDEVQGNQHGIASDEYIVSDNRGMLAHRRSCR